MADPTEYLDKCRHELQMAAIRFTDARSSYQFEKNKDSLLHFSELLDKELALDKAAMAYVDALDKMKKHYLKED